MHFYPRSPCGERQEKNNGHETTLYISIHALLAESDLLTDDVSTGGKIISIHALLAESDFSGSAWVQEFPISIHALLAESDLGNAEVELRMWKFLSTLSLRRATKHINSRTNHIERFLSTLSLRRATAKVHKTVGHFCAYGTNFMGIASSC